MDVKVHKDESLQEGIWISWQSRNLGSEQEEIPQQ